MRTKIRLQICVLALLLLSASFSFAVNIYRGLNEDRRGKAKTSPSEFRIDGNELSTFDDPARTDRNCNLEFTVDGQGNVVGMPGYTAASTPPPDGHWSIYVPDGVSEDAARRAFSDYAKSNGKGHIHPDSCR